MTNKEKYANKIVELSIDGDSFGIEDGKLKQCCKMNCVDCYFLKTAKEKDYSCLVAKKEWANAEYHEPKHFTEDEKQLIKLLDKIKWVARDKDDKLYGYTYKPIKINGYWQGSPNGSLYYICGTSLEFKSIKWEDEEPTSREEILMEEEE